jgi:hypothetical protein
VDRLGRRVMQTNRPALVAFFAQAQGGLFAVVPKVFD